MGAAPEPRSVKPRRSRSRKSTKWSARTAPGRTARWNPVTKSRRPKPRSMAPEPVTVISRSRAPAPPLIIVKSRKSCNGATCAIGIILALIIAVGVGVLIYTCVNRNKKLNSSKTGGTVSETSPAKQNAAVKPSETKIKVRPEQKPQKAPKDEGKPGIEAKPSVYVRAGHLVRRYWFPITVFLCGGLLWHYYAVPISNRLSYEWTKRFQQPCENASWIEGETIDGPLGFWEKVGLILGCYCLYDGMS